MNRDAKAPGARSMLSIGLRRRHTSRGSVTGDGLSRTGAAAGSRTRTAARLALAAGCALVAALAASAPASAVVPVFSSSFTCDVATPCDALTSITPNRLAVDEATGDVYVIDSANDVVDRFDRTGTYLSQLTVPAGSGGTFKFGGADDDIAVDNSSGPDAGNVYVVGEDNGSGNGLIAAFDSGGGFLWQVDPGQAGQEDTCGVAVGPAGDLWTGDFFGGVQQRDVTTGALVGNPIVNGGTDQPCHFAIDSAGSFLVAHWSSNVDKYDESGSVVTSPFIVGNNRAVAVDRTNDSVFSALGMDVADVDAAGTPVTGSPFGFPDLVLAVGVTVNGPARKVYVSDRTAATIRIYDIPIVHTLTVMPRGSGDGSVTADSGAIDTCSRSGGTCAAEYVSGTPVVLTATPDPGNGVTWTGCDTVAGNDCTVTVNADTNVTATFEPQHMLTVAKAGNGSGAVRSAPAGIDCGATCSTAMNQGHVILTATAAAGSTFAGWSGGGCAGTGTCDVNLTADATVTATFAQNAPSATTGAASSITLTGASLAGTANPNGVAATCTFEYGTSTAYGSSVACASTLGSGTRDVAVSAALVGLGTGTTYHYRLVVRSAGGTTDGADQTFTTSTPPSCATDATLCPSPPPPGNGTASISAAAITVTRGLAPLKLTCTGGAGATCSGKLTLTAKVKQGKKTKTITVGSVSVSLAAGKSATLRVKLSSAAKKILAKRHKLKVSVKGLGVSKTVTLKQPARRKKR